MFYVIDGSATMVTGGTLVNEKRTNAESLAGTGIQGGMSRAVAKGDFIVVPENTPHWFSSHQRKHHADDAARAAHGRRALIVFSTWQTVGLKPTAAP